MRVLTFLLSLCTLIALVNSKPDSKPITQQSSSVTVTTQLGTLQGSILTSRLGKHIYAFRGVRYAKAPINELRFQPPQPVQKWEGIFNASLDGPSCPQPVDIDTSEDCLLLNIYTTKLPKGSENPKRPVMVFFHGDDFHSGSGSSNIFGPQYLMDQDIVLVVPNYRLGPLGFLSTGTKEAPGNLGLKDQVEALKWVKANIAVFGGDPEAVTIAGQGAGAASVTLHMLSELSKGLFNQVIIMSGSSLANIPVYTDQIELAHRLAKLVNCTTDSPANMVDCLKTKNFHELGHSAPLLREFGPLDPHYIWLPVAEPNFGQEQFLPEHPITLIMKEQIAQVPMLIGVTTDELANHALTVLADSKLLENLNANFETIGPIAFMYEKNSDISRLISKQLKTDYLRNKPIDNTTVSEFVQLYSDSIIGFGVYRTILTMVHKTKINPYHYRFNYKGRYSTFYLPTSNGTNPYGVSHGDDLIYLFHNPSKFPDFKETDPEIATIEKMTKIWGNFVQKGKPLPDEKSELFDNVKWEPFTLQGRQYMDIGNKLVPSNNLNTKLFFEWDKMFPYERITTPTPKGKKPL